MTPTRILVFAACSLFLPLQAQARQGGAPVNDLCSGAIEVPCDGTPVMADNSLATVSPNDPMFECDAIPVFGNGTLWYRFTATTTAVRILSTPTGDLTDGGNLSLLQGDCNGGFTQLRCTRPITGISTRIVSTDLTPGLDYYIEVASSLISPLLGAREITVECLTIPPPTNDDCFGAIEIEICEPEVIITTGSTSGTVLNDVWFKVRGTGEQMQTEAFSVDVENFTYNIYEGCGGALIASSSTTFGIGIATWDSTLGTEYFIQFGSQMPDEGVAGIVVATGGSVAGTCDLGGGPGTCTSIGFNLNDDGVPLGNGQELGSALDDFVLVTTTGPNAGAAVYNSFAGGPNGTSADGDLLVNTGNILILQNDNNPLVLQQTVPGVFDNPNDDPDGGSIRFEFPTPVAPMAIQLVDVDSDGGTNEVVLTDFAGRQRTYSIPDEWTGDRSEGEPGMGTLDLTTVVLQPGFASVASASQDTTFDEEAVTSIDVRLVGSGGVDDLSFCTNAMALIASGATPRNGSGVNPTTLESWSRPMIGGTWVTSLDCSGHGAGGAALFVFRSALDGFVTPYGELLVSGPFVFALGKAHQGNSLYFEADVPANVALLGREASAQALCTGSPGPQFSNALDVTLGL